MVHRKRRAIVCGTKFGRVYLKAFLDPAVPFELAGILGRGSDRTRRCAERYGVPLLTSVAEVPDDVEAACVVVGAGAGGGEGAILAQALMDRGIHVLEEHPLLPSELADCLRTAHRNGVQFHFNTHYVTIAPVRAFIDAARRLAALGPLSFVDAACSIQVAYTLFDILGEALGGVRPWAFVPPAPWPEAVSRIAASAPPYRTLEGVLAGVPLTLRVQNELDPRDPDNHSHQLHRITIGGRGGCLTLVDTHGPVVWTSRLHLPASAAPLAAIDEAPEAHLDYPTVAWALDGPPPTHRQVLGQVWPRGVVQALTRLAAAIDAGTPPLERGQYHLAVCEAWRQATRLLGFPAPPSARETAPVPPGAILSDARAQEIVRP
ncbi:Gfo/Idh/MocA family oxidoreductase [Azospirillum sp. RWY-5-1]|uniref:Gfo/Idh/MocA family oxidoreductase n=1 Tax=Azospirillum oleiclasticum TaxID=2735135 RepID=A0ABX2TJ57_9PROT|nr:Gfo/Idh/MocA family oxidoreductase [Azospirillum oleiclasticum]NYZ14608.1 Gfo/Idh/MocA family oxidoreductase [Azospirillum oleiclasticum]NYZ24386.1 Gfo/Idh/MocA family oxidoreductase [Azospirillum oleiclasticum]